MQVKHLKMNQKNKEIFHSMLLNTLRAALLGNLLAGIEATAIGWGAFRAGDGVIQAGDWTIRAGATAMSWRREQYF